MRYMVVGVRNGEFVTIYEYFDNLSDAIECMNRLNKRHMDIESGTFYAVVEEVR